MFPLIFDHVGSSGGLSFSNAIAKSFPPEQILNFGDACSDISWEAIVAMTPERRHEFQLIWGHQVHRFGTLIDPPFERITVIRHPVTRYISDYLFRSDQRDYPWYAPDRETALARLPDYVATAGSAGWAGHALVNWVCDWFGETRHSVGEAVRLARHHLHHSYGFVGVTELFEESLILLCERYPWLRIQPWSRVRVGSKAWDELDMDPALLRRIEEIVAPDLEIYREIREKLEADFAPYVEDDAYLGYKGLCIAQDRKLTRYFLRGEAGYLLPMSPETRGRLADHVLTALWNHADARIEKMREPYLRTIVEQDSTISELRSRLEQLGVPAV